MTKKSISEGISNISSRYIEEAADYSVKKKSRKSVWIKLGTMAACVAIAIAAFSVLTNRLNKQSVIPSDAPNNYIADNSSDITPSDDPNGGFVGNQNDHISPAAVEIHIDMDNIFFNDFSELLAAAPLWYDPDVYDHIVWNTAEISEYYGKDLTPVYIPVGLKSTYGTNIISDKIGNIVLDTVWMGFYHDIDEFGSPILIEDIMAPKGFSVTVSKIGLLKDCIYILPENEVKASDIDGTSVTFGYRSMPYGPYDPDTHEPSGYYDMYVVQFNLNDVEYQIVAEQMAANEVVKVVSSIICGEETIVED